MVFMQVPILLVFKSSCPPILPSSLTQYSTFSCYREYRIIYLHIWRLSNAGWSLLVAAAKSKSRNSDVISHPANCPENKDGYKGVEDDARRS